MQKYLISLIAFILIQGCGKPEDTVLARFDREVIQLPEFRQALGEAKIQIRDPKIAREKLLEEMIAQRLLAAEARTRGIQLGESEKLMLAAYREECLRQEFFRQHVEPKIKIEPTLLEEVIGFRQLQRHLQYLLFVNPADAERAVSALQQGERFENLLQTDGRNPALPPAGGDWGWVRWDDLEYPVAVAAFRLQPGEFSQPILARNWSYIVHVVAVKPGTDFHLDSEMQHAAAEKILRQKLGEQQQTETVTQLMQSVKIQTRLNVLNWVSEKMQQFFKYRPADLQAHPEAWQVVEANLWEMRHAPLFLVNDSTFTVGHFLSNLPYTPIALLQQNFKLVLDDAIRNYFLAQHAAARGLEPAIAPRVEAFANRKLVELLEKKLEEKFSATDPEIEDRFNRLQTQGKIGASLAEAKPLLTRQILQEKARDEATRLARHIREKKEVSINYRLLHEFN
jgi:hypothetical protein